VDVAAEFERVWQFPHCSRAIDVKHVKIVPPQGSGSYYFNHNKKSHSVVLMAIANANCEFLFCDIGTNGRMEEF
jgi:hypothetical protein